MMPKNQNLVTALEGIRGQVAYDAPLRDLTSLRVGGAADALVSPESLSDLCQVVAQARKAQVPVMVLGGTNLLIRDGGIRGIVLNIAKLTKIEEENPGVLYAEAGVRMPTLLGYAGSHSLSGLEWAVGIPGTVGGAVVMNAGTRLGEMKQCVQAIRMVNPEGSVVTYPASSITFAYRQALLPEGIVAGVWMQLAVATQDDIQAAMKAYLRFRKQTQPLNQYNAGSVFKNPPNYSAGQLIEETGLKGLRIGDAQVASKHANFIVNLGNARAIDVILLVKKIQQEVFHRTGIMLELEWKIVGEGL